MKMVLAEVGSDLNNYELYYAAQVVTCSPADEVNPAAESGSVLGRCVGPVG